MELDYQDFCRRFENPPAAHRPMMFWIWNGDLERERIAGQIADMAEKGCGGFFIHPMGERFRLADFVEGISPPYLSEGYFEAVRFAVEEAGRRGLYAWLYDEGGWPSGTAQGRVLDGHPEHTATVLRTQIAPTDGGRRHDCPEGTVAAAAIAGDGLPVAVEVTAAGVTSPQGATTLIFFVATPAEGRVDLLSQEAVGRFIEVTHERYAECVGEFFGGVIPGMFTDEPSVPGRVAADAIPWTAGMIEAFKERTGADLPPLLPALFSRQAVGEEILQRYTPDMLIQARCEFCDLWTDLYRDAYWVQINRWCSAHDLIHTGHVGGEDNLPDHGKHGFGHFFKTAGALHAPGVDVIWRQLHWDADNFSFPKLAASAAHQRPGQGGAPDEASPFDNLVVTETNGVYGFGLTFEQMRWLVDYQCLRGINMIGPMSYSLDTRGGRLFRTQDHVGPSTPRWEQYRGFADYVGRLCAVLRSGVALADVAVYYPIEAAWADPEGEAAERAWQTLRQITRTLHEEQVAFDFIPGETIAAASVADGALETPGQFYGTIIVPETPALPADVARQLLALHESGGRVAFVGEIPQTCSGLGADETYADLIDELSLQAVRMDADAEGSQFGGDTREGLDEAARWDGFGAALLGPSSRDRFAAEISADKALLIVPEEEIGRLARMLTLRSGHYAIQPGEIVPQLRLAARSLATRPGPIQIAFMMNESPEPREFQLDIIADQPSVVERWDPANGRRSLLAAHNEINEAARVGIQLGPGESALLVVAPSESSDLSAETPPSPRRENLQRPIVIQDFDAPDAVRIISAYHVEAGDVRISDGLPDAEETQNRLGPWDEIGLPDFSGAVEYTFSFTLAAEYLCDPVFLDLGEVCYTATVRINDRDAGSLLWRPHILEVSDLLREHENLLTVTVTNTLANQVCSEGVVAEAKRAGWFNTYYERALPMMAESLRSGLIGPVRIYIP